MKVFLFLSDGTKLTFPMPELTKEQAFQRFIEKFYRADTRTYRVIEGTRITRVHQEQVIRVVVTDENL